jgi:S1-C subfamily serine protease
VSRLVTFFLAIGLFLAPPQTVALKITVTVKAADGTTIPVPRHALLISDDPVTTSPHRYVTKADGTAEAFLKPGNYIVESDAPFIFAGKAYQWAQPVTVRSSGDTALALTTANATVEAVKAGTADSPAIAEAAVERAESTLATDWQDSVVTIWTPRAVGRGFLVDRRGLIATNQRLIGRDTAVEVQVSTTRKVAGRVVASDPTRNVAIVWIDPQAAPAKPMTLGYAQADSAPVHAHDTVYSIEGRAGEAKGLASGTVDRVTAHAVSSDVMLGREDAGAPLFTLSGAVIAITTAALDDAAIVNELSPDAVRIDDARPALAEAEKKLEGAAPPASTPLPIEPAARFPEKALESAAKRLSGKPSVYTVTAADFEVSIITPPVLYASMHKPKDQERFDYTRDDPPRQPSALRPLDDFGSWDEYVSDVPPVLLVRVTPKFGENFWTTVARGAAQTQGVAIPAIKKPKAPFGSLHLTCGDTDVAPIHPFRIGHRVDDGSSLDEGFYVFAPSAISPQCAAVKITVFSDKPSDKGDTRTLDAKIIQQIWDDFAPFRAAAGSTGS